MTATIEYEGDCGEIVVGAVLRHLATDQYDGAWFVECETHAGDAAEGFVVESNGENVTLQTVDSDGNADGQPKIVLAFDTIARVIVP